MGWLDAWERRAREAIGKPDEPPPTPVAPRPKAKLETVWIQTAFPGANDAGAAEIGYYTVEDGVVILRNENGTATGAKQTLGPNDEPRRIAGRLRRAAWEKTAGEGNFNRAMRYPRIGVA